jgi:hypothetical protein
VSNKRQTEVGSGSGHERLDLRYIPLTQARRWDANPKKHDLDAIVRSIETHGFGDPPKFDATLGALVYGNGRTEALERMREAGRQAPRGIGVLDDGDWAIPVIFGVDAESHAAAVAFAIDHNNLVLGGGLGVEEMLGMWDEQGLQRVLADTPDAGALLASLAPGDVEALLHGPTFEPVTASDQPRLDRKKTVTCPHCGEEFRP